VRGNVPGGGDQHEGRDKMRVILEGSRAAAEAARMCRVQVVAAYPITPQTHIVEDLAEMVASGKMPAQFVRVESEHSAASVCLGAAAVGTRAYSATTSQGLLLMAEVIFNISGMRLPMVFTIANRSVSAPLNIWNDHQDSMTVRDSGWIQLWAEDCQEVFDMHLQAYHIAEDHRVYLPVLVNMDGFILTHTYEPVELPKQEEVDAYLPPFDPLFKLDPADPYTLGAFVGPELYEEVRYTMELAMQDAKPVIVEAAEKFRAQFGRYQGALLEEYRTEDADTIFVAMGSIIGTLKDTVDSMREAGKKVGVLKVRCYRPFPGEEIYAALKKAKTAIVVEKAASLGAGHILATEIRSAAYGKSPAPRITGCVIGLGGRDITPESIEKVYSRVEQGEDFFWADLKEAALKED
jgi:pyruvate ferredoxin oxidoreductase alpha subunit